MEKRHFWMVQAWALIIIAAVRGADIFLRIALAATAVALFIDAAQQIGRMQDGRETED